MYIGIYTADGSFVTRAVTSTETSLDLAGLAAGNYYLWIGPQTAATSTMTVSMELPYTTAVPTDGNSTNLATTLPSENAYVTFQANAGDSVNVAINNLTLTPASPNSINWTVTAPDGSMVMNAGACATNSPDNCSRGIPTLPQTGTYTVNVLPQAAQTMSFSTVVAKNIVGTITPGTVETLNLSELGQEAKLAFTVTSGQSLVVSVTGISTVPSSNVTMYIGIYTADGSFVTRAVTSTEATLDLNGLAAGSYYLWIGPQTAATSTMQLSFQ